MQASKYTHETNTSLKEYLNICLFITHPVFPWICEKHLVLLSCFYIEQIIQTLRRPDSRGRVASLLQCCGRSEQMTGLHSLGFSLPCSVFLFTGLCACKWTEIYIIMPKWTSPVAFMLVTPAEISVLSAGCLWKSTSCSSAASTSQPGEFMRARLLSSSPRIYRMLAFPSSLLSSVGRLITPNCEVGLCICHC